MNKITSKLLSVAIAAAFKIGGYGDMFDNVRNALAGKKTYLVAVGMIVAAVIEFIGTGDMGTLINKVIEATAFMTIRAGVAKSEIK